uniref:Calponin-homology (CH) domain-containing protein n=1 Tax=Paramormyrops kingsleyae TaxID=1676925 RepID=A0A3B3QLN3_9TELE
MAGHEWDDWFEREELIGQISDIRVQNLQAEREGIQKRTFTKWMNLHLEKCNPPLEITDLFNEIRDGRVLMALLEELSGSGGMYLACPWIMESKGFLFIRNTMEV